MFSILAFLSFFNFICLVMSQEAIEILTNIPDAFYNGFPPTCSSYPSLSAECWDETERTARTGQTDRLFQGTKTRVFDGNLFVIAFEGFDTSTVVLRDKFFTDYAPAPDLHPIGVPFAQMTTQVENEPGEDPEIRIIKRLWMWADCRIEHIAGLAPSPYNLSWSPQPTTLVRRVVPCLVGRMEPVIEDPANAELGIIGVPPCSVKWYFSAYWEVNDIASFALCCIWRTSTSPSTSTTPPNQKDPITVPPVGPPANLAARYSKRSNSRQRRP
jgi:hypothetical protein